KAGSRTALTAATTTGKYAGSQPAMTALTASFSMLASRQMGGITPSTRAGSSGQAASMARTRSGVGGTMGRPSHHSRFTNSVKPSSSAPRSPLTPESATMCLLDSTRDERFVGPVYRPATARAFRGLRVFELTRDRTLQVALRLVQLRSRRGSRGAEPTEGEFREGTSKTKPRPSRAATGDADERGVGGRMRLGRLTQTRGGSPAARSPAGRGGSPTRAFRPRADAGSPGTAGPWPQAKPSHSPRALETRWCR